MVTKTAALTTEPVGLPLAPKFGRHLPALDGVRGVAILAVFLQHYGAGGVHSTSLPVKIVATFCGLGWSGVDLFFVLSGFLITGILFDTQHDPAYYRKFYARRMLRIFPIYYLFVLITLLIIPHSFWQKGQLILLDLPWLSGGGNLADACESANSHHALVVAICGRTVLYVVAMVNPQASISRKYSSPLCWRCVGVAAGSDRLSGLGVCHASLPEWMAWQWAPPWQFFSGEIFGRDVRSLHGPCLQSQQG